MYNFDLLLDEKLINVFDDVLVIGDEGERVTSMALTNKRLLFLDYVNDNLMDALRITGKLNLVRTKEVYYYINLDDISFIDNNDYCVIKINDGHVFRIDNLELYKLLLDK